MIELYELRQFAAFADCGTLVEAAEILHLSQPALSRNMKKLEEELGVPLFSRRKNKLELNENGKYALALVKDCWRMRRRWPRRSRALTGKTAPLRWASARLRRAG